MGKCSYCHKWQTIHDECFGWDEARRCCGVTRPEHLEPRRASPPPPAPDVVGEMSKDELRVDNARASLLAIWGSLDDDVFHTWAITFGPQLIAAHKRLASENARLKQERDDADQALIDKYRNPRSGTFSFPGDVAAIIRSLEAAEAHLKVAEDVLRPFADKPDDWTVDQVNAARAFLHPHPNTSEGE